MAAGTSLQRPREQFGTSGLIFAFGVARIRQMRSLLSLPGLPVIDLQEVIGHRGGEAER